MAFLRRARDHLSNAVETDADRDWKSVSSTLGRLSDLPRWPGRTEFPGWLLGEVLPRLRFAVLGASETSAPDTSPEIAEGEFEVDSTDADVEDDGVVVTSHLPAMIASSVPVTVPGVA